MLIQKNLFDPSSNRQTSSKLLREGSVTTERVGSGVSILFKDVFPQIPKLIAELPTMPRPLGRATGIRFAQQSDTPQSGVRKLQGLYSCTQYTMFLNGIAIDMWIDYSSCVAIDGSFGGAVQEWQPARDASTNANDLGDVSLNIDPSSAQKCFVDLLIGYGLAELNGLVAGIIVAGLSAAAIAAGGILAAVIAIIAVLISLGIIYIDATLINAIGAHIVACITGH